MRPFYYGRNYKKQKYKKHKKQSLKLSSESEAILKREKITGKEFKTLKRKLERRPMPRKPRTWTIKDEMNRLARKPIIGVGGKMIYRKPLIPDVSEYRPFR